MAEYKVIEQMQFRGTILLFLDRETEKEPCTLFEIEGKAYKPVPVTGMRSAIAIEATGDFIGKKVLLR